MATEDTVTETTPEAEARSLALEAIEAREDGNAEEAKFLADEAKALDPKAAAAVLKPNASKGAPR